MLFGGRVLKQIVALAMENLEAPPPKKKKHTHTYIYIYIYV